MAVATEKDFALEAMTQENASVGREDGRLVVTRQLSDEVTDVEDILDLVDEHHSLDVENVTADVQAGEMRVWVKGGDEA
jgi:hypothetical protein